MNKLQHIDRGLLVILFLMFGIGIVQVYSSSFIFATESRGSGLHFVTRQASFAILALTALLVIAHIPFRWIEKWGFLFWGVASAGVVLTYVPSLAIKAGGASRWIHLPFGQRIEPGEYLKLGFCILMATYLARRTLWMGKFEIPIKAVIMLLPLSLLIKQPDFGTFSICILVGITTFFIFGLSWKYILGSVAVVAPLVTYLIMSSPYRMARLAAFIDPWADPEVKGFQVIQSMLSFHSGGVGGVGLGLSQGKLFFLPEAHTDFTLAVLGEEMGFIGFAIILLLYGYLILRGFQIGVRCQNTFAKALVLSLIVTFAYSVFINIGVVLGLLPTKGLTLPFLSYGGSSLLMWGMVFGLILNVERNSSLMEKASKKTGYRINNGPKKFVTRPIR